MARRKEKENSANTSYFSVKCGLEIITLVEWWINSCESTDSNRKTCMMAGATNIDWSIQEARQLHNSNGWRISNVTNVCFGRLTAAQDHIDSNCMQTVKRIHWFFDQSYEYRQEGTEWSHSIEYTSFGIKETAFPEDMATKSGYLCPSTFY